MVAPDRDHERTLLAIAALAVEDGLTQREIAAVTGKSQPEISRLYREACDSGLVVQEVRWPDDIDRSVVDEIAFADREELQQHLERLARTSFETRMGRGPFQKVHIIHGGSEEDDWEIWGRKAGLVVGLLARTARVIGVAWGVNIDRVVRSMPTQPADPDKVCLPVAGEPLQRRAKRLGATQAAELLAKKFGAKLEEHLLGVGHRIPRELADPEQVKTIRAYLASSPSYRHLFGSGENNAEPLIETLEMVLTGLGSTETSQASRDPLYLDTLDSEAAADGEADGGPRLQDAAACNVAGIFLPRDPADVAACEVVARVNANWLGISLDSLQGCARRAIVERPWKPGVVVVAAEPAKAEAVLAAVKAGVVSNLVISRQLASSLLPRA
jgi:DNA-binding transcriptional regulator LsrR (DeoR family)